MKRRLLLLLPLLALAAGCSDLLTDSYRYGSVDVRVERRTGEPVRGLDITLYNPAYHVAYGSTDFRGTHRFTHVPEGSYGVFLSMNPEVSSLELSHFDFRDGIVLEQGESAEVVFTVLVRGPGTVTVTARDTAGAPAGGVQLALTGEEEVVLEAVTDAAGFAVFGEVPFGLYDLVVPESEAYEIPAPVEGILIDEGWVEEVEVVLVRRAAGGGL